MGMFNYTADQIRDIAAGASSSLKEIDHNITSHVISFRCDSDGTRINVYYTTGTVGTCLNHPKKGKTQLFRRDVSMEQLEQLFIDPRAHTGKGYYRKHQSQYWKSIDDNARVIYEVDSARRWRFVAAATGLSTNQSEIDRIAAFCLAWDSLYWDPGQEPIVTETKFACGSRTAFENMVLDNASKLMERPITGMSLNEMDEVISGQRSYDDMEILTAGRNCCNLSEFLEVHEIDIRRIRTQLTSFRKIIQIELMNWFFARDNCGYALFDDDTDILTTKFSYNVNWAHRDYAVFAYTKSSDLCPAHGVK